MVRTILLNIFLNQDNFLRICSKKTTDVVLLYCVFPKTKFFLNNFNTINTLVINLSSPVQRVHQLLIKVVADIICMSYFSVKNSRERVHTVFSIT